MDRWEKRDELNVVGGSERVERQKHTDKADG